MPSIPGLTTAGTLGITNAATKGTSMFDPISLGIAGAGAIANIIGARKQAKLQKEQMAQDQKQFAVGATQLDPFAQQKQRQKQAVLGQLVNMIKPSTYSQGQGFSGGTRDLPSMLQGASSFFGPEAMAGAESAFHRTVGAAAPTYAPGLRTDLGYAAGTGPAVDPLAAQKNSAFGSLISRMSPEAQADFLRKLQAKGLGNAF